MQQLFTVEMSDKAVAYHPCNNKTESFYNE